MMFPTVLPGENIIPEFPGSLYSRHDSGSVEVEVGEFLYAMVKLLKPSRILETGSYKGVSSAYMAMALRENSIGFIDTIEFDPQLMEEAKKRWEIFDLNKYINPFLTSSLDFEPGIFPESPRLYDFMFLDTEPNIRFQELVKFYPYLKPGGFVFLHDLPRGFCKGNINLDHPEIQDWPWGPVPQEVQNWLRSGELKEWHFPNPREMCGFYKRRDDDYQP